jgi:hypothetical protein
MCSAPKTASRNAGDGIVAADNETAAVPVPHMQQRRINGASSVNTPAIASVNTSFISA